MNTSFFSRLILNHPAPKAYSHHMVALRIENHRPDIEELFPTAWEYLRANTSLFICDVGQFHNLGSGEIWLEVFLEKSTKMGPLNRAEAFIATTLNSFLNGFITGKVAGAHTNGQAIDSFQAFGQERYRPVKVIGHRSKRPDGNWGDMGYYK